MDRNAHELWNSFRSILRDATFFPKNPMESSFEETLQTIKSLAFDIAPEDLLVVDRDMLEHKKSLLTPEKLTELAESRKKDCGETLSAEQIREREIVRGAILKPVDLLSFPHPEIRAALISRFGAASSAACLQDIFDLDRDSEVKAEIMLVVGRRLGFPDIKDQEKWQLISFAETVIAQGFYAGIELDAALTAFSALRSRDDVSLPPALTGIKTTYWSGKDLTELPRLERLGVLRFFGGYMTAPELLEYIAKERDVGVVGELLRHLETNWELGVSPDGFDEEHTRTEFSKRVAFVLLSKLGLEDAAPSLRNDLLRSEPWGQEPPAQAFLKKLALRAVADFEDD